MSELQEYWNASVTTVPDDKDPSAYAIEKEKLFPRNATVCDLGGGTGADSLYFASQGHKVKLIDISNTALERAGASAARLGVGDLLETVQCNMDDGAIPLSDTSCDIVYSRLALHYFERETLAKLFAEVYRILKSDGEAYLTLKSPDDSAEMEYLNRTATVKAKGVFDEDGHIKARFSLGQLAGILQAAGIEEREFRLSAYTEKLSGRKDRVKSGNAVFLLNEIRIAKS